MANFRSKLRDRKYSGERFVRIIPFQVDPLKLRRVPILFSIFCLWTWANQNWGYLSKTGVGLNQQVTWFAVPYIVTAQVTLDKPTQACIMNARGDHQVTCASFHIILYCIVIVVHDGGKINRGCCGLAEGWACLQFVISGSLANPALVWPNPDSPDKHSFQAAHKLASVLISTIELVARN